MTNRTHPTNAAVLVELIVLRSQLVNRKHAHVHETSSVIACIVAQYNTLWVNAKTLFLVSDDVMSSYMFQKPQEMS